MPARFFLIDFENVQPKAIGRLKPGESRIKVFVGQNQSRLAVELVSSLQPFGTDAEYIQIQGAGSNALDFHIAFYIGHLASQNPGATFHIISKDKGFDPLTKHLSAIGITCHRLVDIPGATGVEAAATNVSASKPKAAKSVKVTVVPQASSVAAKAAVPTTTKGRVSAVVVRLKKSTKPSTLAKLRSSIRSWFKPELEDKALDAVIQSLQDSNRIKVAGSKVTYNLG